MNSYNCASGNAVARERRKRKRVVLIFEDMLSNGKFFKNFFY
jgi:hypothetical protein